MQCIQDVYEMASRVAGTRVEDVMEIIFWEDIGLKMAAKIEVAAYSNFNPWLSLYLEYCKLWVL